MRACLVDQSGNVVQAVVLGAGWQDVTSRDYWQPLAGQTVVLDDTAGIGWTYSGKIFAPPPQSPAPPPTPLPPDPLAAKLDALQSALLAKGTVTPADLAAATAALQTKTGV